VQWPRVDDLTPQAQIWTEADANANTPPPHLDELPGHERHQRVPIGAKKERRRWRAIVQRNRQLQPLASEPPPPSTHEHLVDNKDC
jgi:hypothetical protein